MGSPFGRREFETRLANAQAKMGAANLSALLLTQEADIRYFTGFLTRFWESPTRPWFVILPASGLPVAVIPAIGAHLMGKTWVEDIRTWPAPDPEDDGVTLLTATLAELAGPSGRIGIPSALESHMRMPRATYLALATMFPDRLGDDCGIVSALRAVKSPAEIGLIRTACEIAGRAFDRVPGIARAGTPLDQVFRHFQMLCLEEGADWVSYLAGGAGAGGYDDVISPATAQPLVRGDVLMIDTGLVHQGYFCDFDRNYAVGDLNTASVSAHSALIDAAQAGFEAARPGRSAADLHKVMAKTVGPACLDGRLGHGLGMQLTEGMSLIPKDHTVLEPGMVLTLEPGIALGDGQILVHEENIVITETGAEPLSPFAGRDMPVLEV